MTNPLRVWSKRQWLLTSAIVVCGVAVVGGWRLRGPSVEVPTLTAARGDFVDTLQIRGEVKALRSISITAPSDGDDYQIVKIATDGAVVKKGDPIVEFDSTKTQQSLAQNNSVLKSTEAEIEQVRAQGKLTEQTDLTAVTKAQFDVDSARLEASKKEIVSEIEGQEAMLKLADAEEQLRQAKAKLASDRLATEAKVREKQQDGTKAAYQLKKAQHSLSGMIIRAPQDGTVSLEKSMWRPEGRGTFRPGDRAWSGAPIAQIPDTSSIRITAHVDESERGRLRVGLPVTVQLDAIPDRQLQGKIKTISAIASADFGAGWPFPKDFSMEIALDGGDPRLRPGMSAQLTIEIERTHDAIVIPASAVFEQSGKPVVYVLKGRDFRAREIEVGPRSGDRIMVIKGVQAGDPIALKDPKEAAEK
jgi:RND family efflux transporter MFP subunit